MNQHQLHDISREEINRLGRKIATETCVSKVSDTHSFHSTPLFVTSLLSTLSDTHGEEINRAIESLFEYYSYHHSLPSSLLHVRPYLHYLYANPQVREHFCKKYSTFSNFYCDLDIYTIATKSIISPVSPVSHHSFIYPESLN